MVAEVPREAKRRLDPERAKEMAARSAETRRAAALERREPSTLAELRRDFRREDLGLNALVVANDLIQRVGDRKISASSHKDTASLIRVLVDVGRLESGQATSHSVSLSVSATAEERDQRVAALRQALDARSSERDPKGTTGNTAGERTGDAGSST